MEETLSELINANEALYKKVQELERKLKEFKIHGTDGCKRCELGRITIFVKSEICTGCQLKGRV